MITNEKKTEQPVSTKKSAKPKYVTHDELVVILKAQEQSIEAAVNKALEDQFKANNDSTDEKINAITAKMSQALMQHTEALNSLGAMIQGGQPQTQQEPARARKLDDFIAQVQNIMEIPIVKQKLGIEADPLTAEADALINANWTAAKREFIAQQKRQLKQAFRRSLVFPEEVEGILETAGSKAVEHGI